MIYFWALLSVFLSSTSQIFLKKGAGQLPPFSDYSIWFMPLILLQRYILLGVVLQVLALVIWLYVLRRIDVSIAYPLVSLGFVYVAVFGVLVYKESFNFYNGVGLLLIVSGVVVLGVSSSLRGGG